MASPFLTIANATKAVLVGIDDATATVDVREADVVQARDSYPLTIVTMGEEGEDPQLDTTGAGTAENQGDVGRTYQIGVSIYREKRGDIDADDTNLRFVRRAQQLLGIARPFPSVPTCYRGVLVRHPSWEAQEFAKGVEVSRFAVIFHNAEARCG